MQIETIAIENYRLFRQAILRDLPRMCVVVGANGSGKSTLFDVFSFLKDALTQNVSAAVARRGGFHELVSREQPGPIRIELKFRESGGRLATYELQIAAEGGRPVVQREILKFRRGSHGKPWHFVDFSRGRGSAITNEAAYGQEGVKEERKEYVLDDPSVLAIKGLGQFKEFRVVAEFRSLIENWHISDFHISEARPSTEAGYAEHLSPQGENVAQVAQYMFEHHRERFNQVLEAMRRRSWRDACRGKSDRGWAPCPALPRRQLQGPVHRPLCLGRHDQDVRLSAAPLRSPAASAAGGGGAGEPTLPRADAGACRGVSRLRAPRRAGLRLDPFARFPQRRASRRNLLARQA